MIINLKKKKLNDGRKVEVIIVEILKITSYIVTLVYLQEYEIMGKFESLKYLMFIT